MHRTPSEADGSLFGGCGVCDLAIPLEQDAHDGVESGTVDAEPRLRRMDVTGDAHLGQHVPSRISLCCLCDTIVRRNARCHDSCYDYDYDLLPATGQQDGHRTAAP